MSIGGNLANYLFRCNHYEAMTEKIRQKIAANPYYQKQTVFERIDKFKKGHLVPDDFSEFMLENKIYPTQIELYLIFREFDKERAGIVTLKQLTYELLPKENQKLYEKAISNKYYRVEGRLSIDLEHIISKYFEHKLKQIKELSLLRTEMLKKQLYTVEEAFEMIDIQKQGYLSQLQEVDQFLRKNGKLMNTEELARIFRGLCFDQGNQVTYEQFCQQLDPLGRGYYIGYQQRVAQKQMLQQAYLRRNYELKESSREKAQLKYTIAELQENNSRLSRIITSQEVERRMHEEQLLAYRLRRRLM